MVTLPHFKIENQESRRNGKRFLCRNSDGGLKFTLQRYRLIFCFLTVYQSHRRRIIEQNFFEQNWLDLGKIKVKF